MKTRNWILAGGLAALTAVASGLALGDSDHDDDAHGRPGGWIEPRADVAPVANPTYSAECGACHMAYQPGLLAAESWRKILAADALADHYGDDASLAEPVRTRLAGFLAANAADRASRSRSRAFAVDAGAGPALPRITTTRYFRNEHHEIPARLVTDNPGVGSFSRCEACHQGAEQGVYNEHRVRIPGVGRWDD